MGLVSLFTDFSSEMMNPLLPVFIAGLVGGHWAAFWVGLTEGIAETTASLLKIFSGRLSDKLGKRKALVVAGYGISTVSRPLMALAGLAGSTASLRALQVVALKFFDRVGKGARTSPRDALIGDSVSEHHRGLAFSFHRAMDHLGAILGPVAAMVLLFFAFDYAHWGPVSPTGDVAPEEMNALRWLFGIALLPGLVAMATLISKVREIPTPGARESANILKTSVWKRLPKPFYAYVGTVTLFALGNSSDMFLMLYAYERFGFGLVKIIALWIVLHVSKVIFSVPGGLLSDRLGRRPVIVAGWVVYGAVYLGFAFISPAQEVLLWLLLAAYGFYFGMTEGVEKALVADFVTSPDRATAFGIYHGAIGLAALPASLLFGVFWTALGPKAAFGIGAGLAVLAAVALTILLSESRKLKKES